MSEPINIDFSSDLTIENLDPLVHKFVGTTEYRNKGPLSPQHPFRMLIVGASSIGKTNTLVNIVMKQVIFDKIYIYLRDQSEDKYEFLFAFLESLQKQYDEANETHDKIYEVSSNPEDIVKNEDLDKDIQNLIILDDMVTTKNQKNIEDLFIRCRKRNASIVYQTQNLFAVPQNIRKNCNYVLLFSTNKRERKELAKSYASDIESKEFETIYMDAISEPFSFMVIDNKTPHKCMRYRKGFDGLLCDPENQPENISTSAGKQDPLPTSSSPTSIYAGKNTSAHAEAFVPIPTKAPKKRKSKLTT